MDKGGKRHKKISQKAIQEDLYYRRTDGHFTMPTVITNNGHHPLVNGMTPDAGLNNKPIALHHRPRVPRKSGGRGGKDQSHVSDNLNSVFDPIKDLHMWTMWRTAVNGRIVDQVRRQEKAKSQTSATTDLAGNSAGPSLAYVPPSSYGTALSGAPPLSRFIRLDDHSKYIAQNLVREGQGQLKTSQFIYYGLPRVIVHTNADRDTIQEPPLHSLHHQHQRL